MTLEEKFLAHVHQLQNKQFTVKIEELIHDLAIIAEKYYVGEVLRPALKVDKLEKQLEGQEVIAEFGIKNTDSSISIPLRQVKEKIYHHINCEHEFRVLVEVIK